MLLELRDVEVFYGRIQAINSVVNPDKLRHVGPLADPYAFLRRRSIDG